MRTVIVLAALLMPFAASAQVQPTTQSDLASSLAGGWSRALTQNDVLIAQIADLNKHLAQLMEENAKLRAATQQGAK